MLNTLIRPAYLRKQPTVTDYEEHDTVGLKVEITLRHRHSFINEYNTLKWRYFSVQRIYL